MENNITVIWGGTLEVFLSKLKDVKARIKRLGVYYMCIDDLPL